MKTEKVTARDFIEAGITLVFAIASGLLMPVFLSFLTKGV